MCQCKNDIAVLYQVRTAQSPHVIAYLIRAFHLAPKHSPITRVYAQVLSDELTQPEGCLLVVHLGAFLHSREEPAVAVVSPRGQHFACWKRGDHNVAV
jgi:hypothetical protein